MHGTILLSTAVAKRHPPPIRQLPWLTSHSTKVASNPRPRSSSATCSPATASRSASTTRPPASAKSVAVALAIPCAAPVITGQPQQVNQLISCGADHPQYTGQRSAYVVALVAAAAAAHHGASSAWQNHMLGLHTGSFPLHPPCYSTSSTSSRREKGIALLCEFLYLVSQRV